MKPKGDLNDAYVDYRRAYELLPDNLFVQQDLVRLSGRLGLIDDQKKLRKKFALPERSESASSPSSSGQLIIFVRTGINPADAGDLSAGATGLIRWNVQELYPGAPGIH